MRKLLSILFVCVLMVGCSGSKGCGCPSWGMNDIESSKTMIAKETTLQDATIYCN